MYTITLRSDALTYQCDQRGLTMSGLTMQLGMSKSSLYRVYHGKTAPSAAFVAGCAVVFGTNALPELFHFGNEEVTASAKGSRGFAPVARARSREEALR